MTAHTPALTRRAAIGLLGSLPLLPVFAGPVGATQAVVPWDDAAKAALRAALDDRARHGLDRVAFLTRPDSTDDADCTGAALGYARALAQGIADPTKLQDPFTLKRASAPERAALASALSAGRLDEWLVGLPPQDPDYARLSQAYRDLSAMPDSETPPIGPGTLKVGQSDPRVPTIVAQLIAGGHLSADFNVRGTAYTSAVATGVKTLQSAYGIADDGVVGPDTLGVLNQRPADRARAVAVALERRRWLDRTPPATRIDVNTATAELRYFRDGALVDTRRVVVGKRGTETPPLQSPIHRLVANPTWTVPKSIQNGELANVGADYLAAHNMTQRDGWIVQGSGPDNALGLVKFDMANTHAIYLHDTSAPELFDASQRHRSHGCVRVADAAGFAQMLADDQGLSDQWFAAQVAGEQQFVPLKRSIPVRLLYQNVSVDDAGALVFRTDPYNWNAPVARALGFAGPDDGTAEPVPVDIAP